MIVGLGSSDPLIWTPGAIDALKGEVNTLVMSLQADAVPAYNAGVINHMTWGGLEPFFREWEAYRDSIGFFAELSGATASTLQRYRDRAVDWRNKLGALGVAISTPSPPVTSSPFSSLESAAKWLGIGALAIAGAVLVGKGIDAARRMS